MWATLAKLAERAVSALERMAQALEELAAQEERNDNDKQKVGRRQQH